MDIENKYMDTKVERGDGGHIYTIDTMYKIGN